MPRPLAHRAADPASGDCLLTSGRLWLWSHSGDDPRWNLLLHIGMHMPAPSLRTYTGLTHSAVSQSIDCSVWCKDVQLLQRLSVARRGLLLVRIACCGWSFPHCFSKTIILCLASKHRVNVHQQCSDLQNSWIMWCRGGTA